MALLDRSGSFTEKIACVAALDPNERMPHSNSARPRAWFAGLIALSAAAWGLVACSSEPEPLTSSGGSSASAGAGPTSSGGSAGAPSSGAAGSSAGLAGQAVGGLATSGGGENSGGGMAGAATAGGNTGGSAGSSGSAGSAGSGGNGGNGGSGGGGPDVTKPIKVWIAGDSTVQNCSSACPCGWGSQFDALFNDKVTVVNSAVGGRSIQTWLYESSVSSTLGQSGECTLTSQNYDKRWTAMLDANSGMQAGDYLFIQFGINDTDSACPRHVGTTLFKTYLATMAAAAKERGATPVFVTPVSAIVCSGSTAQPTRGRFATATSEQAASSKVALLDLHQLSIDLYNQLGFCPNDENYAAGKLGDFFCQDHTHFETAGAKQIASLVAGALEGASLPLAQYLK